MGLFSKFDNIYNTNLSASQIENMKVGRLPYEDYDKEGNLVGYFWHYGDTIELDIEITGNIVAESDDSSDEDSYITIPEYLRGKNVRVVIYNFRYEPLLEKEAEQIIIPDGTESTTKDAKSLVRIIIDEETSKKLLRGTYYLVATVVKENESIYIPIIEGKNCKITII